MVTAVRNGEVQRAALKPGDQFDTGPYADGEVVAIVMESVTPHEPIAFRKEDGTQDWPTVEVHKPKSGDNV